MTKDRTDQLQAISGINKGAKDVFSMEIEEEESNEEASLTGNKLSKVIKSKSKEKSSMEIVFKHVNEIIALVETIKENIVLLKKYHVSIQHSSRLDQKAREANDNLNEDIKSTLVQVAAKIRELESKKCSDPNSAVNRVVNTQKALLMKMQRDAMEEYEKALVAHRKICEDILKKELLIVIKKLITRVECVPADIQVSDDDLLAILDSEDTAVFVDNYMKETAEARELLQDVRDRHKEVLALEKDIIMIKDMFLQLGFQVAHQGELIDKIEYHIGNGLYNATRGNKKLSKARKTVGRIRKKKLCIIICITSVLGILIFYILAQALV